MAETKVKNWWVISFSIILPTIISGAALLKEYIEAKNNLELQIRGQREEIRQKYLDMAINPTHGTFAHERILRFLLTIGDDTLLTAWADKELKIVEAVNRDKIKRDSMISEIKLAKNVNNEMKKKLNEVTRSISQKLGMVGYYAAMQGGEVDPNSKLEVGQMSEQGLSRLIPWFIRNECISTPISDKSEKNKNDYCVNIRPIEVWRTGKVITWTLWSPVEERITCTCLTN